MEGENPEKDGVRCYTVPELSTFLTTTGFKEIESTVHGICRRSRCIGSSWN